MQLINTLIWFYLLLLLFGLALQSSLTMAALVIIVPLLALGWFIGKVLD